MAVGAQSAVSRRLEQEFQQEQEEEDLDREVQESLCGVGRSRRSEAVSRGSTNSFLSAPTTQVGGTTHTANLNYEAFHFLRVKKFGSHF